MHRHLIPKVVGAIVLLTALGGGAASAFTAANAMPATSYAGQGTATVSGYQVFNMNYGACSTVGSPCLNPLSTTHSGDPQDGITSVSFQLAPDNAAFVAVDVYSTSNVLLDGAGGAGNCTWSATAPFPGTWTPGYGVWTCDLTAGTVTVSNIGYVDVEAVQ